MSNNGTDHVDSNNSSDSSSSNSNSNDEAVASLLAHVRSGDVLLMNRNCFAMKDVLGTALCLLSKTESRFDHVGMLLRCTPDELAAMPATRQRIRDGALSPSHTYVVETNTGGVTVCAAEQRMRRSSAREVAVRALHTSSSSSSSLSSLHADAAHDAEVERRLRSQVEAAAATPYRTRLVDFAASVCSPPDKMDRVEAAHRYNVLAHERGALAQLAALRRCSDSRRDGDDGRDATTAACTSYRDLDAAYARAQRFLATTYFAHVCSSSMSDDGNDKPMKKKKDGHDDAGAVDGAAVRVNWSGASSSAASAHFAVDGVNDAAAMVCSELVCNLWHRAGLTTGYVPASSMRPFDFLDATRFNFVDARVQLGALAPLKISGACTHHWPASVLRHRHARTTTTAAAAAADTTTTAVNDDDDDDAAAAAAHAEALAALRSSPVTALMASLRHARAPHQQHRHHTLRAAASASSPAVSLADAEAARLRFVNATRVGDAIVYNGVHRSSGSGSSRRDGGSADGTPVAFATLRDAAAATCPLGWCWLVQSLPYSSTMQQLPWRVFACGVLYSVCALPCAPLLLRCTEAQLGVLLVRGTVWTLGCGMFARNLCFAATQAVTAAVLVRAIAPRDACVMRPWPHTARTGNGDGDDDDSSGNNGVDATTTSNEKSNTTNALQAAATAAHVVTAAPAGLVDWRHAYYSVVGVWTASAVVAHVATTPLRNATLARHFGPLRAGPLPRRLLFAGTLALAPAQWLMPYTGCWLAAYETVVAFIVPTRSSVLRPRGDLLQRPDWPHLRRDALLGAAMATLCVDALLHRREGRVWRRYMTALYAPWPAPSLGRRRLAGYHYRLASNALIFAATSFAFSSLALL